MKIIKPIAITDSILTASNVTEDDYDEWDISTTYAADDRVIILSAHKVYESVQGSNLGNDPTTDDGTWWIEIGSTNRWRAFDEKLSTSTTQSGAAITYSLEPTSLVTGLAIFNLGAASVRVQVFDTSSPEVETFDETKNTVDTSEIVDPFTFHTTELDNFETEVIFSDFSAFPNYRIDITIGDGTGDVSVGEIVIGKIVTLGETLEGSEIGLTSFSTKETDDFGDLTIVPRAKSDPVNFTFAMKAEDAGRVKRVLNSVRDIPAVYFADESLTSFGAVTFGLFQDYTIPLRRNGVSIVELEIEGLT